MKTVILTLLVILNVSFIQKAAAQNVSINADGSLPDTSAMLDISSTTKGLLLPRMTTIQQNAIILPATGLSIFNSTLNSIMLNTGTPLSPVWSPLNAGAIDTSSIANFYLKVRSVLSAGAGITYNNATGVISNSGVRSLNGLTGNVIFPLGNLSETGSSVLTITGGTNAVIGVGGVGLQVKQASGTQDGFLSSTDWTTFNNKGSGSVTGGSITWPGTIYNTPTTGTVSSGTLTFAPALANQSNYTLLGRASGSGTPSFLSSIDSNWIPSLHSKLYYDGIYQPLGSYLTANQSITLSGDISGTGTTAITTTLPTVNSNVGTWNNLTVNGKGLVTAGSNISYLTSVDTTNISNFSAKVRSLFSSTAPITYSNGLIGITQATTSANGYLSSADWNTFNGKGRVDSIRFVNSGLLHTSPAAFALSGNTAIVTQTLINQTANTVLAGPASGGAATPAFRSIVAADLPAGSAFNGTGYLKLSGTTPSYLTPTQVTADLNLFTTSLQGLVPGGGTAGKVLHGDGTWKDTTAATNQWSVTGNTGTTSVTNFIGTTDNKSFKIKTNNTQGFLLDSLQNVGIGTSPLFTATPNMEKLLVDAGTSANPTTSYNVISGKGYIDNYLQLNIQNRAGTASASSDVVASNDAATEAINYIDMGVNSSGNTSTGVLGGANTGYLYSTGSDFAIGNSVSGKSLLFFTGGTASGNERMHITSGGNVGVGTTTPNSTFQTNGSVALSIVTETNNYSATASDYTIVMNNSTPKTVTLPTAVGIIGRIYVIKKISASLTSSTIATTSSQTIDGAATKTLTLQYTQITVQSDGANWIVLSN